MTWQQQTQKVIQFIEKRKAKGKGFTPKELKELRRIQNLATKILDRIKADEEEALRRFRIHDEND